MTVDPDGLDPQIREALAQAIGEKKVRITVAWTDRRLLLLYVLIVAAFVGLGAIVEARTDDREALAVACEDSRQNAITLNRALDRLAESSATSPILSPAERRERAEFYAALKQRVPSCPPR